MKIFSVDAETDGLYGPCFAIGVTIRDNEKEVSRFEGRCKSDVITNKWVIRNIIPALTNMPITYDTSEQLEESFWDFFYKNKDGSTVITHCGSPVESGLFRRCVERNLNLRTFSGPFPAIHDVATLLLINGFNPASVDEYNKLHNISVPFNGVTHHPLYDAIATAVCWESLVTE